MLPMAASSAASSSMTCVRHVGPGQRTVRLSGVPGSFGRRRASAAFVAAVVDGVGDAADVMTAEEEERRQRQQAMGRLKERRPSVEARLSLERLQAMGAL